MTWKAYIREHPQVGQWYVRAEQQPNWVVRAAILAAVLVVVVPIVVLTLAAVLAAGAVFLVGSLIASLLRLFTGGRRAPVAPRDGRENVRVIQRP